MFRIRLTSLTHESKKMNIFKQMTIMTSRLTHDMIITVQMKQT